MRLFNKFTARYRDFEIDHPVYKTVSHDLFTFLGSLVAAFFISFNYRAFIFPVSGDGYTLVTGGVAGLSQVFIAFGELVGFIDPHDFELHNTIQSIATIVCNLPLLLLAYFGIGKRFAVYTLINVIICSILISALPNGFVNLLNVKDDMLARAIIGGVFNGLGIVTAVQLEHSTGGTDIVSLYIGLKKGKSIGKYVLFINGFIILAYTIIKSFPNAQGERVNGTLTIALYTIIYLYVASVVIDKLTNRNKKIELKIITNEERLSKVLVQIFPHGCTIIDGKGGFYGLDKKVILTVISSYELKKAEEAIYRVDPHAFVIVNEIQKVNGHFFIRPIK